MRIERVPIDKINPAPYNPRKDLRPGDPEYEALRRSIGHWGLVEPLVWNERTGNLVGGHQRLKVLIEQGVTEVEVSVVDLDPDDEMALNLALNRIQGDWDEAKLETVLRELDMQGYDLDLTGFTEREVEEILAGVPEEARDLVGDPEEDEVPEPPAEPVTEPGDLWLLGRHRLLCGDATKAEDIQRLMGGATADMVFVDPPYGVDYTGGTADHLKIQNDNLAGEEFSEFLRRAFRRLFEITKPGGPIYVCHADTEGLRFRDTFIHAGWELKQCLIWVKNTFVLGRQDYHWRHEPILYGWKPGATHAWYGGRRQDTVVEFPADVAVVRDGDRYLVTLTTATGESVTIRVPSYEVVREAVDETSTVWRFDRPVRSAEHPTMKPVALVARAIRNSSRAGEIVVDTFAGSGSTLIAAEQTGRICYAMELDPRYCDVIVERWEKLTGRKAKRVPADEVAAVGEAGEGV